MEREEAVEPTAPGADLTGHWRVEVQCCASTVEHEWIIERGPVDRRPASQRVCYAGVESTVEGDEVISTFHQLGNGIPFLFSRFVGKTIQGDIHLGEYQTARFVARRAEHGKAEKAVFIPAGRRWQLICVKEKLNNVLLSTGGAALLVRMFAKPISPR